MGENWKLRAAHDHAERQRRSRAGIAPVPACKALKTRAHTVRRIRADMLSFPRAPAWKAPGHDGSSMDRMNDVMYLK